MNAGTTNPDSTDERAAYAAWIRVSAGAVRGLTHSLGNRLHAIEMTLGSITPGEAVPPVATGALDAESAACAELVRLYRMLPLATNAQLEASRVGDILPDAVSLFRHHIEGGDSSCHVIVGGEPPAVLVPPLALTQAMLVLLCDTVRGIEDGASVEVSVTVSGDPDAVRIDVSTGGSPGAADDDEARRAVRWMLRDAHAEVQRVDAVTRVVIPSLTAARRRERTVG